MRAIPSSLDPRIVTDIDHRLDDVQRCHDVRILWAIESGSRAWGFPSPDSDYDCRFLYRRRPDAYLSLWSARDVIETPLDHIFDVNGWDLSKSVRLIVEHEVERGARFDAPTVSEESRRAHARALADEWFRIEIAR